MNYESHGCHERNRVGAGMAAMSVKFLIHGSHERNRAGAGMAAMEGNKKKRLADSPIASVRRGFAEEVEPYSTLLQFMQTP